jgi:hypothetical protein
VGYWGPAGVAALPRGRHLEYWNDFICTLTTGQSICQSEPIPKAALNSSGYNTQWQGNELVEIPFGTTKVLSNSYIFKNVHVILKGTIVGAEYVTLSNGQHNF